MADDMGTVTVAIDKSLYRRVVDGEMDGVVDAEVCLARFL